MNPRIWGSKEWFVYYTRAYIYPDNPSQEDKELYYNYFKYATLTLPCYSCRENFKEHVKEIPLSAFESRTALLNWVNEMENKVREMQGRTPISLNERINSLKKKEKNTYMNIIVIIFILLVIYKSRH